MNLQFCKNFNFSYNSSLLVAIDPITTSECPFIYFVIEYNTKSAPNSRGLCKYGVRNVLSTNNNTPFSLATFAIASISFTFNVGFVGVSTHIIFVFFVMASLTFLGSLASTYLVVMPKRAATLLRRR